MRAAVVLVLASLAIPLAFLSPLMGLVAYCWLAYMRPQELAWGITHYTFGLYTAIALFLGLFVRLRLAFFRRNAVTLLILALWAWWGVTTYTALDRGTALQGLGQISTIFLICLVTTGLCTTRKSLSWVLAAIVGSLAFHGIKHGLYGIVNPGASMDQGIGGMMSGNNENAIAFCFALPILVYTGLDQKGWRRALSFGAAALTAAAIVFSNSRAGFLALVAAGLVMVWRTRARTVSLFVVAPILVGLFFWLAPGTYVERVSTIAESTQTDLSIIHRLNAWDVAATITADHPLVGIGPKNFVGQFRGFPHAWDMPTMEVHNTYLEYTASSGLPGLALYLLLVIAAFRACGRVRRDALARHDDRLSWFVNIGRGLQASMVAFLVASVFGSLMHFDLMYHFCALAAALPVAYRHELERLEEEDLVLHTSSATATVLPTNASATTELPSVASAPRGIGHAPTDTLSRDAAPRDPLPDDGPELSPVAPEDDLMRILAEHAQAVAAARLAGAGPAFAAEDDDSGPQSRPAPYALVERGPRWYRDAELHGSPRPVVVRPDLRPDLGPPEAATPAPDDDAPPLAPADWYEGLPNLQDVDWKTMPFSTDDLCFGEGRDTDTVEVSPEDLRIDELAELDGLLGEASVPEGDGETWFDAEDASADELDPADERRIDTIEFLGGRLDPDEFDEVLDDLLGDIVGGARTGS